MWARLWFVGKVKAEDAALVTWPEKLRWDAFVDNALAFYGLSDASPPIDRPPWPRASAP